MTEAILIQSFKDGDQQAIKMIFELVSKTLLLQATKLTADEMMSEDMVLVSIMKFIIKKDDYVYYDMKALTSILIEITRNTCLDHLRKLERENKSMSEYRFIAPKTVQLEEATDVDEEYARLVDTIIRAIPKQPDKRRQVLEMLTEGKDANEIARIMNIHVSGVYKHRDEFKKYLKEVEEIDPRDLPYPFNSW
jgi:RNA polymerase sigma factor (sigma-70 family)